MSAKRAFDLVAASLGLLVTLPLLLIAGLLTILDSGRPIFFVHPRVGQHGRPIGVLKLRTMRPSEGGPEITTSDDARVTRLGALLRQYKIDELPQLWNVVRGDMSLVGPRPESPTYVAALPEQYAELLTARPGITDPAALAFRHEAELLASQDDPEGHYLNVILPEKVRLSTEYLRERSFVKDLALIVRTVRAMAS